MTTAALWATASNLAVGLWIWWLCAGTFIIAFVGIAICRAASRPMPSLDWAADCGYGPVALYGDADETPIYTATIEHIARCAADDLDREGLQVWDVMGGAA